MTAPIKPEDLMPDPAGPERVRLALGDPAPSAGHPLRGVLLVAAALYFFACNDVTTKHLAASYEVPLVVAVRYIVNCLLMLALLGPSQGRRAGRDPPARARRCCARSAWSSPRCSWGWRCSGCRSPRPPRSSSWRRCWWCWSPGRCSASGSALAAWAAAVGGFAGVLLIVRPGGGLDPLGVACVLGAVAATVVYILLSRLLAGTERTTVLLFNSALVGSVCFGAMLPWFWGGPAPSPLAARALPRAWG